MIDTHRRDQEDTCMNKLEHNLFNIFKRVGESGQERGEGRAARGETEMDRGKEERWKQERDIYTILHH